MTGTRARNPLRRAAGLRWRPTTAAIALSVLVLGATALGPPASASPGALAGTWTSVDVDGSHQTMRIRGAGRPVYAMFVRDDFTSGACGGPPAKVVGHGVRSGDRLTMRGTLVCLRGGNPLPGERIVVTFEYHAGTDTLSDDADVVWRRAG